MASRYVLDAFAYLAFLLAEPGGSRVREILRACRDEEVEAHVCAVNVAEVAYSLRRQVGEEAAERGVSSLSSLGVRVHEADLPLCLAAAALKRPRVSLGDAFAAALAQRLDATLVTGDPEFKLLEGVVPIEWLPGDL